MVPLYKAFIVLLSLSLALSSKIPKLSCAELYSNFSVTEMISSILSNSSNDEYIVDQCGKDFSLYLNNFLSNTSIINMFLYTGKGINELGDYRTCIKKSGVYIIVGLQSMGITVFVLGGCVPPSCNATYLSQYKKQIAAYFNQIQNTTVITANDILLDNPAQSNQEIGRITTGTLITFLFLAVVVATAVVAFYYEYAQEPEVIEKKKGPEKEQAKNLVIKEIAPASGTIEKPKDLPAKEKPEKTAFSQIITCLNFGKNACSFFYSENKMDKNLDCLHGVRVFSMIWIILGHAFLEILKAPVFNLEDIQKKLVSSRWMTIFTSAPLAVDIFFMLSAFFATISCTNAFEKAEKRSVKTVLLMYFQRYVRLLPIYLICFLASQYIAPVLYDGPVFSRITMLQNYCSDHWILNFLYLNNFIKPTEMCMPWTWYLSNDFQFFLIMPLLALLYFKSKSLAYWSIGGIAAVSAIIQLGIIFGFKIDLYLFDSKVNMDMFEHYYIKPYCRINCYLLGIIIAWMYMSCLLYTSPSPRDATLSRMPSSA
eukprot:TRINITY_DN5759_c0_g1_i1.p1 TRINITY_DN5759_c0_g1~~TRINITY_DN5759_c0_g1_i1.p1  ORF type:complete len:539 (+),score=85.90 TRINITY_DN5759_c0_g1_i1:77-1693(+)